MERPVTSVRTTDRHSRPRTNLSVPGAGGRFTRSFGFIRTLRGPERRNERHSSESSRPSDDAPLLNQINHLNLCVLGGKVPTSRLESSSETLDHQSNAHTAHMCNGEVKDIHMRARAIVGDHRARCASHSYRPTFHARSKLLHFLPMLPVDDTQRRK